MFDFDGLLADTNEAWAEAERQAFSKVGVTVTAEGQRETAAMTTSEVTEYWFRCQPWSGREKEHLERDVVALVQEELSLNCRAMPGALEAVAFCAGRGWVLGVATNCPRRVCESALVALGIYDSLNAIVTSEDVPLGKPAPDVYLRCAELLNVHPRNCLVFEDTPSGALAAKRAGALVVGVPSMVSQTEEMQVLADRCLPSLAGVLNF